MKKWGSLVSIVSGVGGVQTSPTSRPGDSLASLHSSKLASGGAMNAGRSLPVSVRLTASALTPCGRRNGVTATADERRHAVVSDEDECAISGSWAKVERYFECVRVD